MTVDGVGCEVDEPAVLWLGYVMPRSMADRVFKLDTQPAIQTQKFGLSCIGALRIAYSTLLLASTCPIQNYPLGRKIFFAGKKFEIDGMPGLMLAFVNILGIKHVTRFVSCVITLAPYIHVRRVKLIYLHGVHSPYLFFATLVRCLGVRTIAVLTDPPGVILPTDGFLSRSLKMVDTYLVRRLLRRCAGVVALAPGLVEKLAADSPNLVFPGILEGEFSRLAVQDIDHKTEGNDEFTIVYAGGLNARYGVDRLLEAIRGLDPKIAVRLKLFGRGDQERSIVDAAKHDKRIVYGGFVDTAVLIPEFLSADLLVNPRPTDASFVSLSFPSKLIEYLSTGCPVLTTRIPTIPAEMQAYFNFIEDETAKGIGNAIICAMKSDRASLHERAARGRDYVRNEFSQEALGRKMRMFADNLGLGQRS
ncbi:MAG: glycosyltransferase [Comamonadaceae bacterium]|nr:glycosyltransferase [Comamonadaceae bacterium]